MDVLREASGATYCGSPLDATRWIREEQIPDDRSDLCSLCVELRGKWKVIASGG